ncbi:MAG: hypothetical protein PHF50_03790 [Patescibacteria group bacterium]|nr:hypothetical protein [Patescibacteria group bacterium]
MNKNNLKIRIVLWLTLAIIISWFGYMKIVPSGAIGYVYDFHRLNYFIGELTPKERVTINKTEAKINGDPVYFFLKTPRRFEKAKVTVKFKNTTDFPIMEIGLLNNKAAWSYDLKPLQNKIIDQLSLAWPIVPGENSVRLIEREKKYDTVEQFLGNLPPPSEIALYNYSIKNNFLLNNYEPGAESNLIDYSFRGSYQFYTYIKQEELDYVFNFTDLNINPEDDPVEIKVYSKDGEIYSAYSPDKKTNDNGRQVIIKKAGLPEGVYRFSVIANDDVITKSIATEQSRFVLINKAWLAEGNKENFALFTNSRLVNAQIVNPASLGKIKVGDGFLDINETYKQYSVKTLNQPAKIELNKDDIIISGDGVFSFSESGLFDPKFKNVDGNLDINGEKINYVLTNYKTPVDSDGWQTASAEFDLTRGYLEKGQYRFLISVPSLKAEESTQGEIIIKEIKVDLTGTTLKQKLKKYFNYAK